MRKLTVGLAALFAVALAAPTFAQDNVSALGSDESAAGVIAIGQTSDTNYKSSRYRCTDPTATSSLISVQVTDCCIAGDIYRATVFKGTTQKKFNHTANVARFAINPGGLPPNPAFAPGVPSPAATIATSVSNVDVVSTAGNNHPGGLPAGWTLTVSTNGGGPVCVLKQNIQ
jgi:hypothetical protein